MEATTLETPAAPPALDWETNFRAALAAVRRAQEQPVERNHRGRRIRSGNRPFWLAVLALVRAMAARPAPGKFSRCLRFTRDLGHSLIGVFYRVVREDGGEQEQLASIPDDGGSVATRLDFISQALDAIDKPRVFHETPRGALKLPHMSDEQLLRMFPHLTFEDVRNMREDESYCPPPAPPKCEPDPINDIDGDLGDVLERLFELAEEAIADG